MKYQAVTISGKICSGKSSLFKNLVQELNWPSYSASQFFRQWSQEHQVHLFDAEARSDSLTCEVDKGMREKILEGKNLILEGWLAGFMALGLPRVLKVLLICHNKVRIERFAKREKITLAKASEEIKKREEALLNKWRRVYGREDFFEPKFYDLVIDTTRLGKIEVLRLVLEKVK